MCCIEESGTGEGRSIYTSARSIIHTSINPANMQPSHLFEIHLSPTQLALLFETHSSLSCFHQLTSIHTYMPISIHSLCPCFQTIFQVWPGCWCLRGCCKARRGFSFSHPKFPGNTNESDSFLLLSLKAP